MFGSTVIDIAIGLIFVYLLLSLVCSAFNELIERFARYRAADLERGLGELVRDDDWVSRIYNHPLIWGLFEGEYSPRAKNLPSYIPATNFALTVMDLILPGTGATGATQGSSGTPGVVVNVAGVAPPPAANNPLQPLRDGIRAIPNQHVRDALMTLVAAAGNDVVKARENIEGWFNSSMDRVSGWYKRRTQLIILLSGIVLAGLVNADTITIVQVLSTDRTMRESLVAAAEAYAKNPPAEVSPAAKTTSAVVPTSSNAASPARSPGQAVGNVVPATSPRSATTATSPAGALPTVSPAAAASTASPASTAVAAPSPTRGCETPECRIESNLKEIKKLGLPIGWNRSPEEDNDPRSIYISPQRWAIRGFGWLITGFAISLGAPFWFDLLNKFVVVRSTVKPREKSPEEPSKD
jgi:hypothetical protein